MSIATGTKMLSVGLSRPLHAAIRLRALTRGVSLRELVAEYIMLGLDAERTNSPQPGRSPVQ